jgi:hypothetical protein
MHGDSKPVGGFELNVFVGNGELGVFVYHKVTIFECGSNITTNTSLDVEYGLNTLAAVFTKLSYFTARFRIVFATHVITFT